MTFRLRHLLAALLLHVLLIGLLAGGVQCTRKPTRPPVIQAVLLDPDRKEQAQQKRAEQQRRQEAERKRQEERRRQEDRKRQEAEAAQQRKAQQEQEQQRREAEAQKKKLADEAQRRKAEEAKRQKELAERKKAEEAARRKQQEQEQRERQEAIRREIQEKALMEEAMREEAARRQAEREAAARAASEREARLSEWAAILERHVTKYWIRPPSAAEDFECRVEVELLPDGTVVNVRVATSCGNPQLDRSVQDAVYRASPMPRPADPSVFERNLSIHFRPR